MASHNRGDLGLRDIVNRTRKELVRGCLRNQRLRNHLRDGLDEADRDVGGVHVVEEVARDGGGNAINQRRRPADVGRDGIDLVVSEWPGFLLTSDIDAKALRNGSELSLLNVSSGLVGSSQGTLAGSGKGSSNVSLGGAGQEGEIMVTHYRTPESVKRTPRATRATRNRQTIAEG